MAMLAEPRRKQRWSLNPRGKTWTEDPNAFGQKMMQKMGWKHGKGLGPNEDGITESLKVSYKHDNKGMGYKDVEQWTAHDDQFSSLLQNLNGNVQQSSEVKQIASLEEKSQISRARIHYRKFTRGKDISRYSEKDLASIFGKKTLTHNTIAEETIVHTETKPVKDENESSLINKGSMADYFRKKLPNFRKTFSSYSIGNNGVLAKEISDSETERVGFGFAQNKRKRIDEETATNDENVQQNDVDLNDLKKKKEKRKKMNENFVPFVYESTAEVHGTKQDAVEETMEVKEKLVAEDAENTQQNDEELIGVKKKKKKQKKKKLDENFISYVHENDENKLNIDGAKQDGENGIDGSETRVKQKKEKKKDKLKQNDDGNMDKRENEEKKCEERLTSLKTDEESNADEPKKKKSKKHKLLGSVLDESKGNIGNEEMEIDTNCNKKQKKTKKKKTEENHIIGISNPAFSDVNCSITLPNDSLQGEDEENTPVKKKKNRKHSKKSGIDNPLFDISTSTDTTDTSVNPYEVKVEKSDTEHTGIDNLALNVSDVIPDADLTLNIVNTPVILKKPINTSDIILSIEKVKRTKRKSVRFSDVLQERIIPNDPSERTNEYIANRNELFDINTMVIEESVKEDMEKQGLVFENGSSPSDVSVTNDQAEINRKVVESSVQEELNRAGNLNGFINNGFDIRSVDKVNFYECKYEVGSPTKGVDNKGFNKLKNHIEETVESISNTIERYQAEVENDINESKANKNLSNSTPTGKTKIRNPSDSIRNWNAKNGSPNKSIPNGKYALADWLVGDVDSRIDRNVKVEDGVKLCFKNMHFKTQVPHYVRNTTITAKKSYRHLIRGDVTLAFKNTNLHEIEGYSVKKAK